MQKKVTYFFWTIVAAIGFTFGMGVFTAIKQSPSEPVPTTTKIAVPAELR